MAAEIHVCRQLADMTGGSYDVALSEVGGQMGGGEDGWYEGWIVRVGGGGSGSEPLVEGRQGARREFRGRFSTGPS